MNKEFNLSVYYKMTSFLYLQQQNSKTKKQKAMIWC